MVTENEVNELLTKHTKKEFLDMTLVGEELLDYRSKVLVSHIWIERLMEWIIIKKFKNHKDKINFPFSKKQKILFELGIINEDLNHELKIFNKIRNVFAHEIAPLESKTTNHIKQFKFYPKNMTNKEGNLLRNAMEDGMITGIITGILTRHLVEVLWETQSRIKRSKISKIWV